MGHVQADATAGEGQTRACVASRPQMLIAPRAPASSRTLLQIQGLRAKGERDFLLLRTAKRGNLKSLLWEDRVHIFFFFFNFY